MLWALNEVFFEHQNTHACWNWWKKKIFTILRSFFFISIYRDPKTQYVTLLSTLDKQRICVNTQLKSSKKQLKWNVCVLKSNSNDLYAITYDVIAYHLVHFVSIRLINKCQSCIDFIFTSERAIYSSFMKISVPSPVFCGKTQWRKWNFAK